MFPAILIGILSGCLSVAFHRCIDAGEALRNEVIKLAQQDSLAGPGVLFLFILLATAISASIVQRFSPEAAGSGIPHVKTVLLGKRHFRWCRVIVVKFASTVIGSAGGLILGRGGPCVHMGSAIGHGFSQYWFKAQTSESDRLVLAAAGGGAGLSAAFNAPLSGLMFVLEELERQCATLEFYAAALACLAADMVCRLLLSQGSGLHVEISGELPLYLLFAFMPLGLLAALLGNLFTQALLWGQMLTKLSLPGKTAFWALLAAAIATTAWYWPPLLGGGQNFVNQILNNDENFPLATLALFFGLRFALTLGSAGAGVAGGLFMPILVIGALLGWGVGEYMHLLLPALQINPKLFALVGMAAYFSAVVKSPLTAMILIIEMTADYSLIMPLFIACFTALLFADWLGSPPIYEGLLRAGLKAEEQNMA